MDNKCDVKIFLLSIESFNSVVLFRENPDVVAACVDNDKDVESVDIAVSVVESLVCTLGKLVGKNLDESVVSAIDDVDSSVVRSVDVVESTDVRLVGPVESTVVRSVDDVEFSVV